MLFLELIYPEDQVLCYPIIMGQDPAHCLHSAKLRAREPVNVTKAWIRQWPTASEGLGSTKRRSPAPTGPGF